MTLVKRLSMKDIHILIGDEDYFAQKVATAHAKDHKLTKTWNAIIVLESSGGVTVVSVVKLEKSSLFLRNHTRV